MRKSECGMDARRGIPHSAFRIRSCRESLAHKVLHYAGKSVDLRNRRVDVRRDAQAVELGMRDRRHDDLVFVVEVPGHLPNVECGGREWSETARLGRMVGGEDGAV